MKLSKAEIQIIARRIIDQLLEAELIEVDNEEAAIQALNNVLIEDLSVEDRLNDEVRDLLEQHSSDMDKSGLEFHRMFKLLKSKLARERNLIL
jgi:hypothetical protein